MSELLGDIHTEQQQWICENSHQLKMNIDAHTRCCTQDDSWHNSDQLLLHCKNKSEIWDDMFFKHMSPESLWEGSHDCQSQLDKHKFKTKIPFRVPDICCINGYLTYVPKRRKTNLFANCLLLCIIKSVTIMIDRRIAIYVHCCLRI